MELKNKIGDLLDKIMELAKKQREGVPYSHTDAVNPIILAIGPTLQPAIIPVKWRDEVEKRIMMRAVSKVAQEMLCTAVVLVSDVRWIQSDKIAPRLGIPTLEEVGLEQWQKLYSDALYKKFKGYVGNMPADWYSEAMMVIAKGPTIGTMERMAVYEKGPNDSIKWLLEEKNLSNSQFNLLPDWWC